MPRPRQSPPPATKPSWLADDITAKLRTYDRSPFMELLAYWLECAPDAASILAFAKKKPDLWVKAMTDLAKISGYSEKQEVLHTYRVDHMSDSQLEDRAKELAARIGLPLPQLLELHANEIQAAQPTVVEHDK